MSKQTPRQAPKQGQIANKQSKNQSSKQASPANKQTTSVSAKQANSANKPLTRQAIKQERRQEERQRRLDEQRRAVRNKRIMRGSLVVVAVVLIAAVAFLIYNAQAKNPKSQNQATPTEQVFNAAYPPVDGVYCDQLEQTAYHHHVHLTIYINGQPVPLPAGMGIPVSQSGPICYYWLHTHASDGIIHIEAPSQHALTLQNFLHVWQNFASSNPQVAFPTQLSLPDGWTIYVNGKQVNGDFSKIDISSDQAWHELITLMYNSPKAKPDMPGSYNWQQG